MTVKNIDPEFSMEMWSEYWNELREKGHIVFQTTHRAKDGRFYPVEIQANFLEFDGRVIPLTLRPRHHRAETGRGGTGEAAGATGPGPENGVGRPPGRRRCPRLQQYADGDPRPYRTGPRQLEARDPLFRTSWKSATPPHAPPNLTSQLLAFARKQTVTPEVLI